MKSTINFDVISDTHIDFYLKNKKPKILSKELEDFLVIFKEDKLSDNLLIAGDIGHVDETTEMVLKALKGLYNTVTITWGNHDRYLISNSIKKNSKYDSDLKIDKLRDICIKNDINFLDGNIIDVEGVKIAGSGFWYFLNKSDESQKIFERSNDSKLIFKGFFKNPPSIYGYQSSIKTKWDIKKSNELYFKELKKFEEFIGKDIDILMSHVGLFKPTLSEGVQLRKWDTDEMYYANKKRLLLDINPSFYIYGHTHAYCEYKIQNTNVLCNPLGYPGENAFPRLRQIQFKKTREI